MKYEIYTGLTPVIYLETNSRKIARLKEIVEQLAQEYIPQDSEHAQRNTQIVWYMPGRNPKGVDAEAPIALSEQGFWKVGRLPSFFENAEQIPHNFGIIFMERCGKSVHEGNPNYKKFAGEIDLD